MSLLKCPNPVIKHYLSFLNARELAGVFPTCKILAAQDENELWKTLLHQWIGPQVCPLTAKESLKRLMSKKSFVVRTLTPPDVPNQLASDTLFLYQLSLKTHQLVCTSIDSWSSDGRTFKFSTNPSKVVADAQGVYVVFSDGSLLMQRHKESFRLKTPCLNYVALAQDINSLYLLSNSQDLYAYCKTTGQLLSSMYIESRLRKHDWAYLAVTQTNICIGAQGKIFALYNKRTFKPVDLCETDREISCTAASSSYLFLGSPDGVVEMRAEDGRKLRLFIKNELKIEHLLVDGPHLIFASKEAIEVRDISSGSIVRSMHLADKTPFTCLHSNGKQLFAGCTDGTTRVWDWLAPPQVLWEDLAEKFENHVRGTPSFDTVLRKFFAMPQPERQQVYLKVYKVVPHLVSCTAEKNVRTALDGDIIAKAIRLAFNIAE